MLICFSPVLSSKRFIVLHFRFRFVIHFELIFVKAIKSVSVYLFLYVGVLKAIDCQDFPMVVQWSGLHASTAAGTASIPQGQK